jgi:hypothetical protein
VSRQESETSLNSEARNSIDRSAREGAEVTVGAGAGELLLLLQLTNVIKVIIPMIVIFFIYILYTKIIKLKSSIIKYLFSWSGIKIYLNIPIQIVIIDVLILTSGGLLHDYSL